tara:strand:- start:1690 stop:1827 length:138 start_codon:yes stop_codon:yes gene_type:complete
MKTKRNGVWFSTKIISSIFSIALGIGSLHAYKLINDIILLDNTDD